MWPVKQYSKIDIKIVVFDQEPTTRSALGSFSPGTAQVAVEFSPVYPSYRFTVKKTERRQFHARNQCCRQIFLPFEILLYALSLIKKNAKTLLAFWQNSLKLNGYLNFISGKTLRFILRIDLTRILFLNDLFTSIV